MNMFKLVCPYCGATLSIENGIDSFYCQYCGGKILLQGQDKNVIKAKVKLKEFEHRERLQHAQIEHKERLQRNQYDYQDRMQRSKQEQEYKLRQLKEEERENRRTFLGMIALGFLVIVIFLVISFDSCLDGFFS